MRLTLKELELLNTASAYNGAQHRAICGRATLELIEYKKIEEELGIDILIFVKLVVYGCYVKDKWADKENDISHFDFIEVALSGFFAGFGKNCDSHYFDFKDYGKTWALTKEELL